MIEEPRLDEELKRLEKGLPRDSSYARLRALLAALPRPPQPKILESSGAPEDIAGGERLGGQVNPSLASTTPPGFESGATIGVSPVVIPYNLLKDPAFEGLSNGVNLTGVDQPISQGTTGISSIQNTWTARTVSGSFTTALAYKAVERLVEWTASNSARLGIRIKASAAGTCEVIVHAFRASLGTVARGTYLVGAIRLVGWGSDDAVDRKVILELYNATVGAVRASQTFTGHVSTGSGKILVCGVNPPAAEVDDDWFFRFRVQVIASGAMGSTAQVDFVEPRLAWMPVLQAPPFNPAIGAWVPQQVHMAAAGGVAVPVLSARLFGDTFPRVEITAGGGFNLGPGNVAPNQAIGTRITGWGAPTGTATRTTFATDTVTLIELARRVKALIDDLTTHGLIGP